MPKGVAYYDEIFSPDGKVREHYSGVYEAWKAIPARERQALHRRSVRMFSGDYAQDSLPRVLTQTEFQLLQRGVEQRGRAILAFLRDYCLKGNRWARVMPASILKSVIERHDTRSSLLNVEPDALAFPYGPDLIRDVRGTWRVVEDSAGMLGGAGDLAQGRKIFSRLMPDLADRLGVANDPLNFFADLADHFLMKASDKKGIPVLYLRSYSDEPDQETRRLAQIFEELGVVVTTASSRSKKIVTDPKGVFLLSGGRRQRVGALICHASPEQLDAGPMSKEWDRIRRFKGRALSNQRVTIFLQKLAAPTLRRALIAGSAWTNFSPGVGFVNDKVFGLYVDAMIRFFLKEDPILASIPAKILAARIRGGGWKLDHGALRKLRRNRSRYVVKQADEDGGGGVWIGGKESRNSMDSLIPRIRAEPEKFIIQEFELLSVMEKRIVDLRIHAHVDSERIIVSNTPWGRANWVRGDGKVNLSANGFTSPVWVRGAP